MNLNRYTEKAQEAILAAQQLAERAGHPDVIPEHLLQTLITQPEGIATAVLSKMQVDLPAIRAASQALLDKLPAVQGGATPGLNARLRAVFQAAEDEAGRLKDEFTSTEHLLLALSASGGRSPAAELLKKHGVTHDAILAALAGVRGSQRRAK